MPDDIKAMTARELKLDYFRIYDIENLDARGKMLTKGQFDEVPKVGQIRILDMFGVCTMKNREPIYDKFAHLTWYRLIQESADPTRKIVVRNQFGDANLWIGKAEALLCPAQKLQDKGVFPENLDHFKVYKVLDYGQPTKKEVSLKDQFGSEKATVLIPDYFAVPVMKKVGRKEFPIHNSAAHLVIYRTTQKNREVKTSIIDQFGDRSIRLIRGVGLAVPSLKLRWK